MARVLLIEDNDDLAMLFEVMLEQAGHSVQRADTLASANEALATAWPEVVLSDLRLPDGHALQWVGEARKAHRGVRFSAMSSSDRTVAQQATEAGFDHYLDKGSDLDVIEAFLRQL